MSTIDLSILAKPGVIQEISFEALVTAMRNDLVARFPAVVGVIDLESEPARKLIEVFAYREMMIRARINDAARANLLAFAVGSDLDHLAAFYDVVRLLGETDAAFRSRTILAIMGRSTGGTEPRYRYAALSASVRVKDAVVWREGVTPLIKCAVYSTDNNGVADNALLAEVNDAMQDPAVRMVNDTIQVQAAVQIVQPVTAALTLLPNTPDSVLSSISAALLSDWSAETGLGFDLTLSWLTAKLMRSGVQKVVITSPTTDVVALPYQAIAIGAVTLTISGRAY